MGKHLDSHWKEILADEARRKEAAKRRTDEGTDDEAASGTEDAAEEGVITGSDDDIETSVWKQRWNAVRHSFHRYRYGWLAASLVIFALCLLGMYGPDGRPNRVRVSGQVLIDGKSLQGGTILFVPEGARPSAGEIDDNGRFTLTCYDGSDGAVVGLHRIEIAPSEVPGEDDPPWPVPFRYANHATSGLSAEIAGPRDDVVIELTTDGAPPPNGVGDVPPISVPEY